MEWRGKKIRSTARRWNLKPKALTNMYAVGLSQGNVSVPNAINQLQQEEEKGEYQETSPNCNLMSSSEIRSRRRKTKPHRFSSGGTFPVGLAV
ncbi:hypothetical protein CEXT_418511 [Caerostris extrusa]|uniref:Uncharacterized protein n=1 Tax=Caerostris extrusa TaxID=172846 RepID=A0AAV4N6Y8_CAEEX|nr:hypothetical protein CEXT_418511 [Caerostris extrusa]